MQTQIWSRPTVFPPGGLDADDLAQARRALTVMLTHHEPYGATVLDRNWNVLMSNAASTRIFSLFVDPMTVLADIGGENLKVMRLTLHPSGLKPQGHGRSKPLPTR
jgi:hypothetical protein